MRRGQLAGRLLHGFLAAFFKTLGIGTAILILLALARAYAAPSSGGSGSPGAVLIVALLIAAWLIHAFRAHRRAEARIAAFERRTGIRWIREGGAKKGGVNGPPTSERPALGALVTRTTDRGNG